MERERSEGEGERERQIHYVQSASNGLKGRICLAVVQMVHMRADLLTPRIVGVSKVQRECSHCLQAAAPSAGGMMGQ